MYILLKKDTFCEISIAQKFINLFKFQPPYRKEELEIILQLFIWNEPKTIAAATLRNNYLIF